MPRKEPEEFGKYRKPLRILNWRDVLFASILGLIWVFSIYKTFSEGAIFWRDSWTIAVAFALSFYCRWRKRNTWTLLSILTFVVEIYLLTFSLEFIQSMYSISTEIRINDQEKEGFYKNITFSKLDPDIVFDTDKTSFRIDSSFKTDKLEDTKDFRFCFRHPEKTTGYDINLIDQYSKRDIYYEKNCTPSADKSILCCNITLEKDGSYNLQLKYYLSKIEPNGDVRISITGQNKKSIGIIVEKMYASIGINDMYYQCITPCVETTSENTTVVKGERRPYHFIHEKNEKPFTYYAVVGNNIHEIEFSLSTTKKYPIILRGLCLSVIAGLIVGIIHTLLKK